MSQLQTHFARLYDERKEVQAEAKLPKMIFDECVLALAVHTTVR
jgi:hypothetical protein